MPWLKMVTLFLSAPQAPPELQRRRRYLKYTSENRRFDQCVLDWTKSSQSCQASNCHRRKMFLRLNQIDRQLWLPMVGGSCTDWSNLRYTGWIYDFRRYSLIFMGGVPLGRYGTYFVIFHWHQFLSNMQFMKHPSKSLYLLASILVSTSLSVFYWTSWDQPGSLCFVQTKFNLQFRMPMCALVGFCLYFMLFNRGSKKIFI